MPTQNVELTDHQAEFIRDSVDKGLYKDASEVVGAALCMLEAQDRANRLKLDRLRAEVQKGIDAYEAGDFIELDTDEDIEAFFEEVKSTPIANEPDAPTSASD